MRIDKRKWTMTVEVVGIFRGPGKPTEEKQHRVDQATVELLLHRALVQMEVAANCRGVCDLSTEDSLADCCLRLHFSDPKNEKK